MRAWLLGFVIVLFAESALSADQILKAPTFTSENAPLKVVLIPPQIEVKELSAGGVSERVDAWSDQAKQHLLAHLKKANTSAPMFQLEEIPTLDNDEKNQLDEHVALFDVVGFNAYVYARSSFPAWQHKKTEFDYTLGPGASFLAQKSGADAALIIIGEDYISTGGRKAARIAAALFGVALPASPTFLSAALVDLKTGNILWMSFDLYLDSKDMRNPEDWDKLMTSLFKDYPRKYGS